MTGSVAIFSAQGDCGDHAITSIGRGALLPGSLSLSLSRDVLFFAFVLSCSSHHSGPQPWNPAAWHKSSMLKRFEKVVNVQISVRIPELHGSSLAEASITGLARGWRPRVLRQAHTESLWRKWLSVHGLHVIRNWASNEGLIWAVELSFWLLKVQVLYAFLGHA